MIKSCGNCKWYSNQCCIKWHKVADGDLPDNLHYVWTNVGAGYHDDDGWWDDFGRLQGVIAWCEPKFEE